MKTEQVHFQFYTKAACPLCDEAKAVLQRVNAKMPFMRIEEIDITKDLRLFTKYKTLIPVLELKGHPLFVHRAVYWKLIWQVRWHGIRSFFAKFT